MSSQTKKTKTKKKTTSSTAVYSDGSKVTGISKGTYVNIRKGKIGKHIIPKKPFSTEMGHDYEAYEVTDNYDSHQYPPPSKNPEFRKFWMETIDNLISRGNFKLAHLRLLETYCRLCVELRRLDDFVYANGHTYRVLTAAGEMRKTYPEVYERHKVLTSLAQYANLLGFKPSKDKELGSPPPGEDNEWG
jgi:hypothetical protein